MQNWQDALLVYSTDKGKIKPEQTEPPRSVSSDGVVRIHRETKGRKGAGVTLVDGLAMNAAELKVLAKKLKQKCSSGGAIKDGLIEIQGDHREAVKALLEKDGFKVKLAGG